MFLRYGVIFCYKCHIPDLCLEHYKPLLSVLPSIMPFQDQKKEICFILFHRKGIWLLSLLLVKYQVYTDFTPFHSFEIRIPY